MNFLAREKPREPNLPQHQFSYATLLLPDIRQYFDQLVAVQWETVEVLNVNLMTYQRPPNLTVLYDISYDLLDFI